MNYQAVLFDFDYTLGDATEAIFAGFTHALTTMGHPAPQLERVRLTIGLPLEVSYTQLTGEDDPKRQAEFRALFSEVAHPMQLRGTPLFDGAEDLLRALVAAGARVGVVSTKRTDTLRQIFAGHGLEALLSCVVGSDAVSKYKPDPEGLFVAARELALPTGAILYCGDTVMDAGAAQAAGIDFAAVLNGTTPGEAFADYPSVFIAKNLPALNDWLKGA